MGTDHSEGIAFIFEGDTEKVFYTELLHFYCSQNPSLSLTKQMDKKTGDIYYIFENSSKSIIIKMYVVGTISQITNSGVWFTSECYNKYTSLTWSVVLCYDTDEYKESITKFYEGDWKVLRKKLQKERTKTIIDMASKADIEDLMLIDSLGVFSYLKMEPIPIPHASKGKYRLKKLFRLKGNGYAYHEGQRAKALIQSLDFNTIIEQSYLPFDKLESLILNG